MTTETSDDSGSFLEDAAGDPPDAGDRQTLSEFKRRSSRMGLLVAAALTLLVGSASVFMLLSYQRAQAEEELVNQAGNFERGSPKMLAVLRQVWPQLKGRDQQLRVIQNLFHFNDPEAGDIYVDALSQGGGIRRFGALGLAKLGPPGPEGAVLELERLLPETDPYVDRTAVTWALAVLGGKAPDAILDDFSHGRYQEDDDIKDQFDPSVIANALGPDRLKSETLLTHGEESVRLLTAQALAELGGPEVVEPLNVLLQNELAQNRADQSLQVIEAAAAGLGRTGHPSAVDILAAVTAQHPSLRQSVHRQLQRTAGAPQLAVLAEGAASPEERRALVGLLAESHDPRVSETFVSLLSDADPGVRLQAALALSEFGDERALETLLETLSSEESDDVEKALAGVEKVASPRAAARLLAALPARCPAEPGPSDPRLCFHRTAFLKSLAATGGREAADRIAAELATADALTAARALAWLNHEASFSRILEQAKRPSRTNMRARNLGERELGQEDLLRSRKAAIIALGHYGRNEAADVLFTIVEDAAQDDFELRLLAGRSLGLLDSEEILARVVTQIRNAAAEDDARSYFAEALWQRPTPALLDLLFDVLQEAGPAGAKRAAGMALGLVMTESDAGRLVTLLDQESARTGAAVALILGGTSRTAYPLLEWIEKDRNLAEDLERLVSDEAINVFDVLTTEMFETGQLWRQLEVARTLNQGTDQARFPYAWNQAIRVLSRGSDGLGRVGAAEARARLYQELTGSHPDRRALAAHALLSAKEYGLLLRARDEDGHGATEARAALLGQ